jgi:hypothetical protein
VEQITTSRGTKILASVEQIRLKGEQIISVCGTNLDFIRNNILAPVEQIMTSRGTNFSNQNKKTCMRGTIILITRTKT